jgi:NAD(P)-dependent dehydrogenase (short-subunit alcohol dehydrogenase family)
MAGRWGVADIPSLAGRRAVVTGGNRGLGLEMAVALAGAGAEVTITVRDEAKAAPALNKISSMARGPAPQAMLLDLADLESVARFADEFAARSDRLDILVNNAAAILLPQGKTKDGFETHFGANVLGTFALTLRLLDRVRAAPSARIVNTGSAAHRLVKGAGLDDPNFERTPYAPMEAYGRSKLATLLFTAELDRRLKRAAANAIAVAAHPGYSNTNPDTGGFALRLATRLFAQPADRGALPMLYAATAPGVRGGDYWGPGGLQEMRGYPAPARLAKTATDESAAERLWILSERLTGVHGLD